MERGPTSKRELPSSYALLLPRNACQYFFLVINVMNGPGFVRLHVLWSVLSMEMLTYVTMPFTIIKRNYEIP
jgi:hypothetical protein